jgi:hypothetical protein
LARKCRIVPGHIFSLAVLDIGDTAFDSLLPSLSLLLLRELVLVGKLGVRTHLVSMKAFGLVWSLDHKSLA